MRVEPLFFWLSYHSSIGCSEAKSRRTGALKNAVRDAVIRVFDGRRDGVRTAGTRAKGEWWCTSFSNSSTSEGRLCKPEDIWLVERRAVGGNGSSG